MNQLKNAGMGMARSSRATITMHGSLIAWCGLACMLAALIFAGIGLSEVLQPSYLQSGATVTVLEPARYRIVFLLFGLVVQPGFFAGLLGYYWRGATGRGRFGKVIIVLAAIGAILYLIGALMIAVTLQDNQLFSTGIVLTTLLSPLLTGIAALRAKVVPTWKRVWPAIMFPLIAVGFGVAGAAGLSSNTGLTLAGVWWFVFGYVVFSERVDGLKQLSVET